jgi:hypothetical protein
MKEYVLISCVSQKLDHPALSKDLYTSPLFKLCYRYATSLKPDAIFVLSAKYGLVSCDQEIAPYNMTLNNMKTRGVKKWSERVLAELSKQTDLQKDLFIFLAGDKYRKFLLPHIRHCQIPMEGLRIGEQLSWLKKKLSMNICAGIHKLFNHLERFSFPFETEKIFYNGIYILFEKHEYGHGLDRIVRVGTHTGKKQLRPRLQQHFLKENKDRSILRKNVGRAILNKDNNPFIQQWELDLTSRKNRKKFSSQVDFSKQEQVEKKVSDYIQKHFSFVVFEVNDKKKRLELESKLISTVSLCAGCRPSANWLGLCSPKSKIRESGLWLINHLYKSPLTEQDLRSIVKLTKGN